MLGAFMPLFPFDRHEERAGKENDKAAKSFMDLFFVDGELANGCSGSLGFVLVCPMAIPPIAQGKETEVDGPKSAYPCFS